jgi:mRNA-degrading endonuclease RelE of RelBE toxin-antitoxin system
MPPFIVQVSPAAAKQFRGLPAGTQARFAAAFERLASDPFRARPGLDVSKMEGGPTYRLRIGNFRGIFQVEGASVVFTRFGHRSTVYR